MNSGKLLTISIAAYNVASYLEQTLESLIVDKNIQQLEVLIVNDGSKDETPFIARRYVDKYPETFILINKENGGHGSTINTGIKYATGKYFKVLDGDDWLDTQGLDLFLDKLNETDADLVLTDRINVYDTKKEFVRFENKIDDNQELAFDSLRKPISIVLSSIALKTELIKNSGYRCLEHCYYEDIEFDSYSIAVSNSYIYYPIDLYQYRLGRESQSVNPANLQKNICMSSKVAKTVDAFYCANIQKLSYGQKLCIIDRAKLIHSQVISTYMTFNPDKENRKLLTSFIWEIKSKAIKTSIKKGKFYIWILCNFPQTYSLIARLYKIVKHIK